VAKELETDEGLLLDCKFYLDQPQGSVVWTCNIGVLGQQGQWTIANSMEATTTDTSRPQSFPRGEILDLDELKMIIREAPQFSENPFHWAMIGDIVKKVAGFVRRAAPTVGAWAGQIEDALGGTD